MRKIVVALSAALVVSIAWGYDVHHPNLKAAYWELEQGIQKIHEAQSANKGIEFGGHAEKAIEAIKHAEDEIVAGDQYNDAHHK